MDLANVRADGGSAAEFAKENHGEARSSKQCNDQHTNQTAYFLAPIITDYIRNTKRELYNEKLNNALEMLNLEWSKDDDTWTQCKRLNTSPLHRGNASNKNGPARVKQRMQWEGAVTPKRRVCQNPSRVTGITLGRRPW